MRSRILLLPALLAGALGTDPAAADSTYCLLQYAPGTAGFATAYASGFWLCADAGTTGSIGWNSSVLDPDAAGAGPVSASQSGENGGVFAAVASATSDAAAGLLRATAQAESIAPIPDDGISFARANGAANATLLERGELEPLMGAGPGEPVELLLTIDATGGFAGSGGSGDGVVTVFRNGFVVHSQQIALGSVAPVFHVELELPGFGVGDDVAFYMRLTASAGTTNDQESHREAAADLGNSGRIFVDVPAGNAFFASTSGHDYRTVPEPAGAWLLAAALAAILARSSGRALPSRTG
jgi:hypothetical protein